MPIPGMNSLDKQIDLDLNFNVPDTCTRYFALGHLVSSFPLISAMLMGFSAIIEYTKLYNLL